VASDGNKNGFVLIAASPKEYKSFADFQKKILKKVKITYQNLNNKLIFKVKSLNKIVLARQ
jgi:hypothetical protein